MTAMTASVSATSGPLACPDGGDAPARPGPPALGSEVVSAPVAPAPVPMSSAPSALVAPAPPAPAPAPAPATRPLGPGRLRTEPDRPAALALGGSASHVPDLPWSA